jgi:tRNA threonylcarbamoyladenosine biosynthesis protein TsaE
MVTNISHSPAETLALGESWGRNVPAGMVIGLRGDLGAGKTQLVKGLARGLGISARVLSPTFALLNVYEDGRVPLFHLDLYRLDTPEQIRAAGLDEYLSPMGITVIEWAERWFGENPGHTVFFDQRAPSVAVGAPTATQRILRWVEIESISESERRISHEDFSS